ncbi:SusC/RagA family TonB-linked outer membrane protein [Dawidia soli]|uniref:SusC/RagA family TonB-linked outer membrane protein n=1 Tax=Dawidia soli TaxID=2782352 RepID=A0AAP2DC33_9BACT|nr:SusC/RagA family TonB-linked outer membrane protein [Dawidia soli]MBT1689249.1 SusC/RagA family TonB-linked outer membrane protein [Dawidia soli]
MRFFTVVTALAWCTLMIAPVTPTRGQDALHTTYVTLTARRMPLAQAFRQIQQKTGLLFVYQPGLVDVYKDVQVPEGRFTVAQALDSVLVGTYLDFTESNRNIIVFKKPVLLKVRGRVTERESGEPLPGVSVAVKDTDRGTYTDEDGRFTLEALSDDVLLFSFTARVSREIKVNNATEFDVTLEPQQLGEVLINAGYYQIPTQYQVGNISSMTEEAIANQTVTNPLQAMQGRMAGVYIEQTSGLPGAGYTIRVRGRNSLRDDGNEPLYIIDGVPYPNQPYSSVSVSGDVLGPKPSPLASINPAAIERIDVLKDADATTIYGSRGANGVVLIKTRRASPRETSIDMNVYQGFSEVPHFMDLLNSKQWIEMRKEAFVNDNATMTKSNARDLLVWDTTRYTDWQKELIGGRARVTSGTLSLSGGVKNTRFLFGGTYYKEGSVFPGDFGYNRVSGLVNLSHHSENDRFNVVFSVNYINEKNELPSTDLTVQAITLAPVAPPVYDSLGKLNWQNSTWINPYSYLLRTYSALTKSLLSSATVSYRVWKGFSLKADMGYTAINREEVLLTPIRSYNPANALVTGANFTARPQITTWNLEPQLEYRGSIGKGKLEALIGATFQKTVTESTTLFAGGYTSDALIMNLAVAPELAVYEPVYEDYRYNALFGRLNYIWDRKYIINLTARRDGSSRFGPERQFANFGAAGVGWIFTQEPLIGDNLTWLSFGKLRVSYGIAGNDQMPDYEFMDSYSPTFYLYNGQPSIIPSRLANPEYSWENNRKLETGLNLGFLKNRVTFDASWYRNRSSRQLVGRPLPDITGFASVRYNLPATVENRGVELQGYAKLLEREELSWSTSFNISFPSSKLLEFEDLEKYVDFRSKYVLGKSLDIAPRFKSLGVNPANGLYQFEGIEPGTSEYELTDLVAQKRLGIRYFGGWQNTVTYGSFQLDFLFQFVNQTVFGYLRSFYNMPGSRVSNQPVQVMDRWQNDGDIASVQRFSQNPLLAEIHRLQGDSDQNIVDGSFVRLKTVSLSYNLATPLLNRLRLQKLRVYVQGQNLFTATDYIGFDPENATATVLPPLRSIAGGLQVTF